MKKFLLIIFVLCLSFTAYADNEINVYWELKQADNAPQIYDLNGIYAFTTPDTVTYAMRTTKVEQVINAIQTKINKYTAFLSTFQTAIEPPKKPDTVHQFNINNYKKRLANEQLTYYKDGDSCYIVGKRYNPYTGNSIAPFVEVFSYDKLQSHVASWEVIKMKWETFNSDCESAIPPEE